MSDAAFREAYPFVSPADFIPYIRTEAKEGDFDSVVRAMDRWVLAGLALSSIPFSVPYHTCNTLINPSILSSTPMKVQQRVPDVQAIQRKGDLSIRAG